jgi:hypothetical protein
LLPELEKARCWNGHPALFNALFQMILTRNRPDDLGLVVLRMPFVIASHLGPMAELQCPDALIEYYFRTIIDELRNRGSKGLVLLIDDTNSAAIPQD